MITLKVKDDSKEKKIFHNNVCKPVGQQTQEELVLLAIEGVKSGDPGILSCFEEVPTLEELMGKKTDTQIAEVKNQLVQKDKAQ